MLGIFCPILDKIYPNVVRPTKGNLPSIGQNMSNTLSNLSTKRILTIVLSEKRQQNILRDWLV